MSVILTTGGGITILVFVKSKDLGWRKLSALEHLLLKE